jgi:amidase
VTVKPGLGRVPAWNPGQAAERGMLAQSMSVQGLITRTARDLALAMPVMIRPDPRDPWHVPLPWAGPPLEGPLRVGMASVIPGFDLHPEVGQALALARRALEDAGYIVEEIDPPGIEELSSLGLRALFTETEALSGGDIRRLGSDTLRGIFEAYHQAFPLFTPEEHLRAIARRSHHARQWSLLLDTMPLVLTPCAPDPMFPAGLDADPGPAGQALIRSGVWANAMNFLGLPAGVVPTHLAPTSGGVQPLGVQIIGRRWREDLVVQAMQAIEDRLGPMAPRLWARDS